MITTIKEILTILMGIGVCYLALYYLVFVKESKYDDDTFDIVAVKVEKIVRDSIGNIVDYQLGDSIVPFYSAGVCIEFKKRFVPSSQKKVNMMHALELGRNGLRDTTSLKHFSLKLGSEEISDRIFYDSLSKPFSSNYEHQIVIELSPISLEQFKELFVTRNEIVSGSLFDRTKLSFWFDSQDSTFVRENFDKRLAVTF